MKKKYSEEQLREFSRRLNESMDIARLSASDLANKTGIDKSAISNYVNGKYMPKQDKIYLLAQALGVSPSWLSAIEIVSKSIGGFSHSLAGAFEFERTETQSSATKPEWNPDDMAWADHEDENVRILARGVSRMSRQDREKLLDVARIMFAKDFREDGTKKEHKEDDTEL